MQRGKGQTRTDESHTLVTEKCHRITLQQASYQLLEVFEFTPI